MQFTFLVSPLVPPQNTPLFNPPLSRSLDYSSNEGVLGVYSFGLRVEGVGFRVQFTLLVSPLVPQQNTPLSNPPLSRSLDYSSNEDVLGVYNLGLKVHTWTLDVWMSFPCRVLSNRMVGHK